MIRTQTTAGTRNRTLTMADMRRTRTRSSYTAGTFHSYSDTDCSMRRTRRRSIRADRRADVRAD
jgi:hypothetical protein